MDGITNDVNPTQDDVVTEAGEGMENTPTPNQEGVAAAPKMNEGEEGGANEEASEDNEGAAVEETTPDSN